MNDWFSFSQSNHTLLMLKLVKTYISNICTLVIKHSMYGKLVFKCSYWSRGETVGTYFAYDCKEWNLNQISSLQVWIPLFLFNFIFMSIKCRILNKMGSSTHIFIRKPFRTFAPHGIYTSLLRMISHNLKMSLWKTTYYKSLVYMHFRIYEWNI